MDRMWVVGIGASAGGVEALRELLPTLPGGAVAYVIAQHMSPAHPSLLIQVLSRETGLPVREIESGMPLEPGVVYVAPPNRDVQLHDGTLVTMQAPPRISPQPSIDILLQSIAAQAADASMGVVLSGTGSDGVLGMQEIHRAGGRTLAQEPASARYRDMPSACIDAGVVDLVLTPTGIGSAIAAFLSGEQVPLSAGRFGDDQVMAALAAETRRITGWDLASYKDGTLGRQLTKRVAALGLRSTAEYLQYVRENAEELEALRDSMLITVTGFLRDRKSFDALAESLRPLVSTKSPGEPLRAWVAGCATGEEAYSVAMLLAETARECRLDLPVKVFATDISDAAMETARRGIYPTTALADVPEEWRQRYFSVDGELAQVDKRLRDMLVIARQDITRDPPLVRMDLVSCRNLLIYLVPGVQERVVNNLHAALGPRGLLFLGRSESIPSDTELFTTVDAASRVFQRRPGSSMPMYSGLPLTPMAPRTILPRPATARPERDVLKDQVRDRLLTQYGPPSILVDLDGTPVHTIGDVSRFLTLPGPDADLTISSMITPSLRTEVTSLLTRLERDGTPAIGHTVVLSREDGPAETMRLQLSRINVPGAVEPYALVSFVPVPVSTGPSDPEAGAPRPIPVAGASADDVLVQRVGQLEHELAGTREHLQAVVEELESSNEELQAMNEELQASSEELQATNEELETTNEELQATNEELTTVNETLEVRTAELSEANVVLTNIQSSVHTAIVLVDREQRLQRFSPLAVKVFGLVAADIGTRIARLPTHLDLDDLPALLDKVMATGEGEVLEVSSSSSTYLLQAMPYVEGDAVNGAVLALSDITELAEARAELTVRAEEFRMLAEAVPHMVYRASVDGAVIGYVSPTVSTIFGLDPAGVLREPGSLRRLVHEADREAVARVDRLTIDDDYAVDYRIVRPDGVLRSLREMSHVVRDERGLPRYRVGTVIDITDLVAAQERAEQHRRRAEGIFSAGGTPMMTLTRDGVVTAANAYLAELLGRSESDLVGTPVAELLDPDDVAGTERTLAALAGADGGPIAYRTRYRTAGGGVRYVDQTLAVVDVPGTIESGQEPFVFAALRDVTEAEEAKSEAAAMLAQLQAVFDGSSAAMAITGMDGRIVRPNAAMCDLFGRTAADLVGVHFADLTVADDLPDEVKLFGELLRGERDSYTLVKRCTAGPDRVIWGRTTVRRTPSLDGSGQPVLMATLLDITSEIDREASALRVSQTDSLTGLLNRSLVFDRLRQAIHHAHRGGGHISVLYLDLDGFKAVNDRLGHVVGDVVLKTVAERLRALTRESDSIARVGDDEFLIVAPHEPVEAPHAGLRLAHDLLESVAHPMTATMRANAASGQAVADRALEGVSDEMGVGTSVPLSITASIGVAHYPSDAEHVDDLVHKADLAMYSAKQRGGNQVTFYSARLQDSAEVRAVQRAQVTSGLTEGQFVPYYQPVLDARSRRIVDVEVLARWNHPDRGVLPPVDFLDLMSEFGALDDLTDSLVTRVVEDLPRLRAQAPDLQVSVNLAPDQLRRTGLVERLTERIGPDLRGWTFEATEAAAFGADPAIAAALARLRDLGARTSLDDFGSGYSSPTQLRSIGFDEVKIDREFACDDPAGSDAQLVRAMVGMAHALGAVTVAEGLETQSQVAVMVELGADRLQGFHFARPMPAADLLVWLSEHDRAIRDGA